MIGSMLLLAVVAVVVTRSLRWAKRQDREEAKKVGVHPSLIKEMRQVAARISRFYDEPGKEK